MNNLTSKLPAETTVGWIGLTTPDLKRALTFYRDALGLQVSLQEDGSVCLSPPGGPIIVTLVERQSAAPPPQRSTGLYHLAVRLASRQALAGALRRLLEVHWPLQGAADHLVSEALYLEDADGNGIELYHDRPQEEWPYRDGQLIMATNPLDLRALLKEATQQSSWSGLLKGARLGHVHLKVSDLQDAETFYTSLIGFDLVLRYGPSAAFVSAGGYHHHIGFNTWNSTGAPAPPPGSAGLRYFSILLPEGWTLQAIRERLEKAGAPIKEVQSGLLVQDPSANWLLITNQQRTVNRSTAFEHIGTTGQR